MARRGFFELSQVSSKPPVGNIPKCGTCGLFKTCKSPKMKVSGQGRRGILLIGDFPRFNEDEYGSHFVGSDGRQLSASLRKFGVDMRRDCWMTNALICRVPGDKSANDNQIDYCRPNLNNTIEELKPKIIIPMGHAAVKSLIAPLWKEDMGKDFEWPGWQIPCHNPNAWICPTYHPLGVVSHKNSVGLVLFERHLKAACEIESRPWKVPPDYKSKVKIIQNDDWATVEIRSMHLAGGPLAFDYETTCLKPESPIAEIVCCSLSDGRTSIAFPWRGRARKAMRKLLHSGIPMRASNMKFEERWTAKEFGKGPAKWDYDTMVGAHLLDCREGITSIKFQVFVRLGVSPYDETVGPFLKSKKGGGMDPNRIKEVPIRDLLLYNGMDSIVEYKVTDIQKGMYE